MPSPIRVVLIEDNPADARLFREQLKDVPEFDVDLHHCERLDEALAHLKSRPADLVVADLSLPDSHGLQTVQTLHAALPRIALVVLTGYLDDTSALRAVQMGAQDYLLKGADPSLIGRTLRYALERKRAEEQVRHLLFEQAARAEAEARERKSRLLAEASRILGASLESGDNLRELARAVVPDFVDHCLIDVLGMAGPERAAAAHSDPEDGALLSRFLPCERTCVAGEARYWSEHHGDPSFFADPSAHERAVDLGIRAVACVPLVARARLLGTITFATGSWRTWGPEARALAEELADRTALAVDNAQLYRSAQDAIRARDDVLGIVSHDLRNPLTVISTTVGSLLKDPDIPVERRKQRFEAILRASERMNRLIQDLLDVSRIEAGHFQVDAAPAAASGLIEEALDLLRPLAAARSIRLDHQVDAAAHEVLADKDRVLQVFSNLLGNALKFTGSGGVVTLTARDDGDRVRFEVNDTGTGIPPEDLPHVFNRFWKKNGKSREGAGLGLAIVKGIVEAHGGTVFARAGYNGAGTCVTFTLPKVASNVRTAEFRSR